MDEVFEDSRAMSWDQFVKSGFDGRDYKFPDFEGDCCSSPSPASDGNKNHNLLVYLDTKDGRKFITAARGKDNFYGLADLPVGTRVLVTFGASDQGNFFLRGAEEL